jgi:hypothetical protein
MTDACAVPRSASCYSPLAGVSVRQLEEFRLITLLPDQYPDRIRCQLTVHSLHNPPPYETISYAWGDPNDTRIIDVDGVELTIPRSLELCLQQLRTQLHHPEDLPILSLWTDAICIDQHNLEERAVQVASMGTIYQRCSSMYIWLGPQNPSFGDQNPFEMILHWYHDKHFYDLPGFSRTEDERSWEFCDNPTYQDMYNLFLDGISRPWWERLWCVQEVALCPKAIVRMGTWWIPWSTFLEARKSHSRHGAGCCKGFTDSMPAKYAYFADPMLFLSTRSESTGVDEIIRSLRHKLCKDPRDKIYGLLALLEKTQSLDIRPDYTITVSELYRQVTKVIATQSDGDLRYLTGSGLGSDCYQLPSWARNFAAPLHPVRASNERNRFSKYNLYHASGRTKSQASFIDDDTLCLSGTFIDHIDRLGPVIEYRDWNHPQGVLPGIRAWAEMAGFSNLDSEYASGAMQEQFWRTITADAFVDDDDKYARIPTSSGGALSSWFGEAKRSIDQGGEPLITPYVFAFWSAMSGRTFFITRGGDMGLCFPHARPGDEVWVLAGGKVPFVLRPFSGVLGSAEPPARIHQLVGECYLDGYMDGEALQKEGNVLVPVHLR